MTNDQYKLKDKSNSELRKWVAEHKPVTAEYVAGIEESMRRVATIEEIIEKKEAPVCKRECTAAVIAILFIAVTILTIVLAYE
ncbi:MAG: hypothetical protein ACNYZG_13275 [Gammaproteobacteria bacterium]